VNLIMRNTAIVTGLAFMIVMWPALSTQKAIAAGMNHGPAGPSPITGLPKNPKVPFQFGLGMQKFQQKCSACHGKWAEGTAKNGPPLVHQYYVPSHHDDNSFFRAARSGVNAHHWNFGNMPPVQGITNQDIGQIVQFIRWWQRENGIH
jgi:mono/diheme cytochrome c family protein